MAKVFTPDAVRRGHVPKVASFPELARAYRDWLPGRPWFAGGILLGSVLQGTQNQRSDIDLLVAFRDRNQRSVTAELRNFWEQHHRLHIPVNINLWDEKELVNGRHTIGSGFLGHLHWAMQNGGRIGTHDPLARIRLMPRHEITEDLQGYIARKVRKLREFSCESGCWTEVRCSVLEDVGMASLHAARRWLALHGHPDQGLRRREDIGRLIGEYNSGLEQQLKSLLRADASYSAALSQRLEGGDQKSYVHALGELSKHVGDASVFLDALS